MQYRALAASPESLRRTAVSCHLLVTCLLIGAASLGHYVVVLEVDAANAVVTVMDPSVRAPRKVHAAVFEASRHAYGTDDDVLVLVRE